MKTKIKFILIIAAIIAFVAITIPKLIFTIGLPPDDKVFSSDEFNELMGGGYPKATYNRSQQGTIRLDNIFADRETAMIEIKKMLKSFLFELSVKYSLPEFSAETMDQYQDALYLYRENNFRASQGAPMYKLSALSYFCQTYKNSESNLEVIDSNNMKSDIDTVMEYLCYKRSDGYVLKNSATPFEHIPLLISELLEYMKVEFNLDILSADTINDYKELLPEITDEKFAFDKEIFQAFYDIYMTTK